MHTRNFINFTRKYVCAQIDSVCILLHFSSRFFFPHSFKTNHFQRLQMNACRGGQTIRIDFEYLINLFFLRLVSKTFNADSDLDVELQKFYMCF